MQARLQRLFGIFVLAAIVSTASAQQYKDSYPKNTDIDMVHYKFHLTFSDDSESFEGITTARARFLAPGINTMRLDLIGKSDALDGKGMMVSRVESGGTDLQFRHEDNQVFITLSEAVEVGQMVDVAVHYNGMPAAGLKIGPNKYGDRTYFSDNWSSRVRNWLAVVDHPYDKATTEMIVVAPSKYQVASNGIMIEATDSGDGVRMTHYDNPVPTATWLYFVGVAQFAIQRVDTYDRKPIETWVYWQDRDKGFYDFAIPSKQVLAYYTELVGPYVNDRLANIVSNATPGGGMEAASTPAYSDKSVSGTRSRRWQHVIIHEIAHQWFGNAVTEYHWNDVWLSEGFATYYTLRFREHAYGRDNFIQGLKDSRNTVVKFYENDYDFQLVRDYIEDLNNVSGSMMYQKGAWVLRMLRQKIGEDVFDSAIRSYYAEHINENAQTADLRRHMEAESGMDLKQFFDQWLFQGGIPKLAATWSADGGDLDVTLSQTQPKYEFNLEVEVMVIFADATTTVESVRVEAGEEARFSKKYEKDVLGIGIDPNTRLLGSWDIVEK